MTYSLPPAFSVKLPQKYDSVTDVYTRMAIYFDLHIYDKDRQDSLLYEYLYHTIYMLACKARYFHKFDDYDQFAIMSATRVYLRFINPNYQEGEKKIVSMLNYVKNTLYGMKVDYQNENFDQIFSRNPDSINYNTCAEVRASIQSDYNYGLSDDIVEQFKGISKYVIDVVKESPFYSDPLISKRLVISLMLSFINSVTLDNETIKKINAKQSTSDEYTLREMNKERDASVILWRLDKSMENIVKMYLVKIRKKIAQSLIDTKKTYELDDSELTAIMMSAYYGDTTTPGEREE